MLAILTPCCPHAGVHGMILLNAEGDCQARTRRLVERLKPSFADHSLLRYKAALQGACKRAGCVLENQAPTLHPPETGARCKPNLWH